MANLDDVYKQAALMDLELDQAELDGNWHRVRVLSKKSSDRSGAYCLSEMQLRNDNIVIVGMLYNWTNQDEARFTLEGIDGVTPDELSEAKRRAAVAAEKSKQERKALQEETAAKAQAIWDKLPDSGKSDYLTKKKVRAHGIKFARGKVVVPARDIDGKLWTLQWIDGDGSKKFMTGGAMYGRFHILGEPIGSPYGLYIAEGYATAATVHEIKGWPVVVAFNAGNILPVAQAFRRRYSDLPIRILADNDLYNKYPQAFIQKSDVTAAVRSIVSRLKKTRPDVQVEFIDKKDGDFKNKINSHNAGVSAAIVAAGAVKGGVLIPRIKGVI